MTSTTSWSGRSSRGSALRSGSVYGASTSSASTGYNGEWQDVTDGFFRCTAWRQIADNAAASFKKGSRVMVAGRLVQRSFESEGQRRTTVEIQVQHLAADVQYAAVEIRERTPTDEQQKT